MGVNFGKFVHTENGKIIMSILLGLGLATLFRTICKEKDCVIFHAPPLDHFKDKIYRTGNGKCVKYVPVSTKCSINTKTVEFE
jgi:hypothetical protein